MEIGFDFQAPSTRYQGSKRKILPWIWEHLKDRSFESVLDVFGGTGSVSYLFKKMGKQVLYNDSMRWNYLIGLALIENEAVQLSESEIDMLTEPVSRKNRGFVSDTFRNLYFTNHENLWIDAVISRIQQLKGNSSEMRFKTSIAYYGLFQTCLVKRPFNLFHRANLPLRLANVERSFGNKTTWERPFKRHFRSFINEIHGSIFQGRHPCSAFNYDAFEIPDRKYDLIYLDPPYLKKNAANETADYLHCYHFLEGLARYQKWPKLIDRSSPLLSFSATKKNIWNDPQQNLAAFESLFEKFTDSIIVISYKKYGCPSIDTLVRLLKRQRKKVRVHTRHYKYALNQQNGCSKLNRECLIVAD